MDSAKGHRQRLLERYRRAGLKGLNDYEIVEMLLNLIIPRRDTKPQAKKLMAQYKNLSSILSAPERELIETGDLTERGVTVLKFIRDISSYCLQEGFHKKEYINSQKDVDEYLRFHFSHLRSEYAVAIFLDNQNRVIKNEIIAEGTVDHCTVYPRKIFDIAFQCEAAALLLAHNHPGGSHKVSPADWEITKRIYNAGKLLNIDLVDHIIVTDSKLVSLRGEPGWPL